MLKKFLFALALAIPMFANAQNLKVGLVDTDAIMAVLPDVAAAQTKLQEVQKKYQDEAMRLEEEYKRLIEDYQNIKEDELPAIRERKTREITDYQTKLQQFEQTASQDLQNQQQALMAPIMQKIREAIESVGREAGYSLIQERGTTIYFAAPVEDITPQVKAKLGLK